MKFLFNLILATCFAASIMNAQKIDVNVKPDPMPAREFQFPQYVQKTLSNGLKVIIIEDKEQPTIAMSLMIFGGSSVDSKTGTASLVSSMLTKGAGKLSASEIATKIDGIGASIGANAGGDQITVATSGLKKHVKTILDLFAEVVTKPTFPKEEFDKLVQITLSNIQAEKADAGKIAGAMSRMCVYGPEHPYAKKLNEEGVQKIDIKDLKAYYSKYFVPNNASIAIIGDIRADEAVKLLEAAFKDWKQGKAPEINVPAPKPMPLGIYFINRPGSTQSSVHVTTPAIPYNHPDYETLDMSAKVIGSGFGGRLFRTLREKYSFTYTPFGALTSSKYANRFVCGADVNKEKTDSSISVILEQMALLANEAPGEDELGRQKKFEVGQYNLSFENSNFIAGLIQQSDFMGISIEKVKGYPQRVLETPASLVSAMANKYMNPKNAFIVVVGDKKILPSLEKFGKVFEYTIDLEPKKIEKIDLSVDQLVEKFVNAIGKDAIAKTKSLASKGKAALILEGKRTEGTIDVYQQDGNKYRMTMDMKMFKQDTYLKYGKGVMQASGQTFNVEERNIPALMVEAQLFPVINLKNLGNKLEVLGKQDGKILLKCVDKNGDESIYYFDENSYYLLQIDNIEYTEQVPTPVTTTYSDYKNFNGLNLPTKKVNVSPQYKIEVENTYEINPQLDDKLFVPVQ